jgi:hypothetical protein
MSGTDPIRDRFFKILKFKVFMGYSPLNLKTRIKELILVIRSVYGLTGI